jgi:RHS repeat-associated protein
MLQPERQFNASHYRFGFSGHEKLDEISGEGTKVEMGARLLDTRLGKTLSPDPKLNEYPGISPYVYVLNTPISAVDKDGKRVYFVGGAGLDTKGWNYTDRWGKAFTNAGIKGFTPLRDVSYDKPGSFPANDILFSTEFRSRTTTTEHLTLMQEELRGVPKLLN